MRVITIAFLLVGCGSEPAKPVDASIDGQDAVMDDGAQGVDGSDGTVSPPRCDPLKAWGLPELLSFSINTVWFPRISGDGLRLYYTENYTYLRMVERPSLDGQWGAPTTLMMIIAGLAISVDELRLYTASGPNVTALYERANRMVPWPLSGQPVTLGFQGALNLAPDGVMYGSMPVAQQSDDLVYADAIDSKTFKAPTTVGAPNSAYEESYPVVSFDGRALFFSSTRPGGAGMRDIYTSVRSTATDPWSLPLVIPTLNSSNDDIPGAISPDGCELFMTTNFKLAVARKPKP